MANEHKGKPTSANFPFKVEFQESAADGKVAKFTVHLEETEIVAA